MFAYIKKRIDYAIIMSQGGEKTSKHARRIAEKNWVKIGIHSYGSCFNRDFNIGGSVEIGRYCSFGPNVRYFGGNHPMDYASMSPYFYRKEWGFDVNDIKRNHLIVGNDVWIGCGVIITSSCKNIGNGAVIAAGAVVTKNVPPYAIMMGVPAKIRGYRFDKVTRQKLELSKWWEKEPEQLIVYYEYIGKPDIWANMIINGTGEKDEKNLH